MKTFKHHKSCQEIKDQCKAQGVPCNTRLYDSPGMESDFIVVGIVGSGHALYNCFNGRFHGFNADGIQFDSDSPQYDDTPWFNDLLNFFYKD